MSWPEHLLSIAGDEKATAPPTDEVADEVRRWLAAVMQSDHLSLLVGSGLSTAVVGAAGGTPVTMAPVTFTGDLADQVSEHAKASAAAMDRANPNLEDALRSALQLIGGLEITDADEASSWRTQVEDALKTFTAELLTAETALSDALEADSAGGRHASAALVGFLESFASRLPSRERLQVFSTNYDRIIEFGCDLAGLHLLDRFVGGLTPRFRASRLDVDLHYNPPGIRGEPRYLEGVLRLTKLHGSLDWVYQDDMLQRVALPFGAKAAHPALPSEPYDSLMIYPNAAKDVETLEYPYAELFRDFSAAVCRPNSALVTYGYGFGDDHVNRVIADMLSLPSTHLVVISFDDCGGRLEKAITKLGHPGQVSVLLGPHLGDLTTLVQQYLPTPTGIHEAST